MINHIRWGAALVVGALAVLATINGEWLIATALASAAALLHYMDSIIARWDDAVRGSSNGTKIRVRPHIEYWIHPATVVNLTAPITFVTIALLSEPGFIQAASAIAVVACLASVPHSHYIAWEATGAAWTEERWRAETGEEVHVLYLEGGTIENPGILAIRSNGKQIEAFVTFMKARSEWQQLRHAQAHGPEIEVHYGQRSEYTEQGWHTTESGNTAHAPKANPVLLRLIKWQMLSITADLPAMGQRTTAVLCHTEGRRERLKKFMRRETKRCSAHGPPGDKKDNTDA